jgi:hypothetical protein
MCAALTKETEMSKMLATLFAGLFAFSAFAADAPKAATTATKAPVAATAVVKTSAAKPVKVKAHKAKKISKTTTAAPAAAK